MKSLDYCNNIQDLEATVDLESNCMNIGIISTDALGRRSQFIQDLNSAVNKECAEEQANRTRTSVPKFQDSKVEISGNEERFCEKTYINTRTNKNENDALKKRLIAIINDCYFDNCEWTEADDFFESTISSKGVLNDGLEILADIVNHNLSNEHILEGVLHILSNYRFDEIEPYGITIAIACLAKQSVVIQDLLISIFEKWNAYESIDILVSLTLNETWLDEYRNQVVIQIKNGAIST